MIKREGKLSKPFIYRILSSLRHGPQNAVERKVKRRERHEPKIDILFYFRINYNLSI